MAGSENTGFKGTIKRLLTVLLISMVLGSIWFYVYLIVGLSSTYLTMPAPLWEALKSLTPFLIVTAGILYIASWRGAACLLYGLSLLLIVIALVYDRHRTQVEQQKHIENNQRAAELATADAEQVLLCSNGEKLLIVSSLGTTEQIPVLDILLVRQDGQLQQRPLATTGLRDAPRIQPDMDKYLDDTVECRNETFNSAAELVDYLQQFIADNQPRL